jgi:phosphopantothenate-cysteine ligase
LSPLRRVACCRAYCARTTNRICVQLETDPQLLVPKARGALERYGHQVVVGNDLNRRKFEVVFVTRSNAASAASTGSALPPALSGSGFTEHWLRIDPLGSREIEQDIITELAGRHDMYINAESSTAPSQ